MLINKCCHAFLRHLRVSRQQVYTDRAGVGTPGVPLVRVTDGLNYRLDVHTPPLPAPIS